MGDEQIFVGFRNFERRTCWNVRMIICEEALIWNGPSIWQLILSGWRVVARLRVFWSVGHIVSNQDCRWKISWNWTNKILGYTRAVSRGQLNWTIIILNVSIGSSERITNMSAQLGSTANIQLIFFLNSTYGLHTAWICHEMISIWIVN